MLPLAGRAFLERAEASVEAQVQADPQRNDADEQQRKLSVQWAQAYGTRAASQRDGQPIELMQAPRDAEQVGAGLAREQDRHDEHRPDSGCSDGSCEVFTHVCLVCDCVQE
jgi:hypothetical protein